MKITRKIIHIDEEKCDGCGQCVLTCAEGALAIIDGKAKVISDNLCDGLGACLGECPQDALHIVERPADEFDEQAVEAHLAHQGQKDDPPQPMPCGCSSTQIQSFTSCVQANRPSSQVSTPTSALTHWPVQIRLIPANAPFLKNADLLVVADCVPVAFPGLHQELLQGKVVMLGCPKFDDGQAYVDKFADIFRSAGIKTVTVAVMEVPCCAGLPRMVAMGMEKAGVKVPVNRVVVSTRGQILEERSVP